MRPFLTYQTVSLALIFGIIFCGTCSLAQVIQPKGAKVEYEHPKTTNVEAALERSLNDFSKANEELRQLYAEGKVKIQRHPQGLWTDYIEFDDGFFAMCFASASGPLLSFTKRVFEDKEHKREIGERGYEIQYDSKGQVNSYQMRDGRGSLFFHPNGGIRTFIRHLDSTVVQASWDEVGKLQGEGASPARKSDKDSKTSLKQK